MRYLIIALAFFATTACAERIDVDECAQDGTRVVQIRFFDSDRALARAYEQKTGRRAPAGLEGFATRERWRGRGWTREVNVLHVKRITSLRDRDMETLGHELLHAFCVDYHR